MCMEFEIFKTFLRLEPHNISNLKLISEVSSILLKLKFKCVTGQKYNNAEYKFMCSAGKNIIAN